MFAWFRKRSTAAPGRSAAGPDASLASALIEFLFAQIAEPEHAPDASACRARFRTLGPAEQLRELPAAYLLLEQHLVDVDLQGTFTRPGLRDLVRSRYGPLLELRRFQLLFEPAARQELMLCRELLEALLRRASSVLGGSGKDQLAAATAWLAGVPHAATIPVPFDAASALPRADDAWIALFRKIASALGARLAAVLGEAATFRILDNCYRELAAPYGDLETFPVVLGLLPEKLLDEDRISMLSRRQTQRVLFDKVRHLEEVNAQLVQRSTELQETHTKLVAASAAAVEAATRHRAVLDTALDAVITIDAAGVITGWNPQAEAVFGWRASEILGRTLSGVIIPPQYRDAHDRGLAHFLATGEGPILGRRIEITALHKAGREFPVELTATSVRLGDTWLFSAFVRDITDRKRLEEQLRQAQKMEAVGRLAGGVAHDFNNILTAMAGYASLLLDELPRGDPQRDDVDEIRKAVDRATALTRQLLAFSRQQVLELKVLDLNAVVANLESMLRRLIGEDVELVTRLDSRLGAVKADAGQLEQVLMNLVVNARDAMPDGGKLSIETATADWNGADAQQPVPALPGRYAMLAVSDTGAGMDAETKAHLFEPFFTTKEKGKGTGLGLATVYGIVKQFEGYIWVYSEPGQGAAFKIYLPCVDEPTEPVASPTVRPESLRGTETVLVVEDEPAVRALVLKVLQRHGYTVLEVTNPEGAVACAANHEGPIHLLLTDVVMPGMGGREVAARVCALRPDLKVLFMSGYTDDAVVRHGRLEPGAAFLQKPFTPQVLAAKVRELLDAAPRRRG